MQLIFTDRPTLPTSCFTYSFNCVSVKSNIIPYLVRVTFFLGHTVESWSLNICMHALFSKCIQVWLRALETVPHHQTWLDKNYWCKSSLSTSICDNVCPFVMSTTASRQGKVWVSRRIVSQTSWLESIWKSRLD